MEDQIKILPVNPETFEYQDYEPQDVNLISTIDLDTAFTASSDYIEFHVYDLNKNLTYPLTPGTTFSSYNIKQGDILINPSENLVEIGFDQGSYFTNYSFYKQHCDSNSSSRFYISEISSDRTELRLDTNQDILLVTESINNFIQYREDQDYFVDFVLNFGNNRTIIANNIELDDEDEDSTILVKLYDPLPSEFDEKSQLWIAEEISSPQSYKIEFPEKIIEVKDFEYIKGPNYNIDVVQQVGEATEKFSFSTLLSSPQTSSFQQLKSLLKEKEVNVSINYENFNEFIKFSSALTRLENFYYKVKVIENTKTNLDNYIYQITGSTTSSVSFSSSRASLETTINSTIENFDGYEYFLYFNSGSHYSWPKSTSAPPYTLYSTNSTEVINWLGSANESLSTYGGVSLTASNYDQNNSDWLYRTIPEYLVEDPQNQGYELFIDMIGQHFDNVWVYTKDITNKFTADNRLDYGISKDLVADAIREFGVKLYQNNYSTEDLYAAFLGITPSGSLFPISNITGSSPQEGQEIVTTYISGSDEIIPLNDVNKRIYKKIYHNLPFLLKSKGTMKGLRTLLSTFGVPSTILEPKEFGGRRRQSNVYDKPERKFNYALKLDGLNTYVETDWKLNSHWSSSNDVPTSMMLRFQPQTISSSYSPVPPSQSIFQTDKGAILSLEYTGTAGISGSYSGSIVDPEYQYGTLRFYPSGSNGVSTSVYLPFFNGDWWSTMIHYDYDKTYSFNLYAANKSSDNQLTQQIGFSANNSVSSDLNFWSGSITASFGKEIETYEYFSGSLQEIKYFNSKISESVFNDYVLNPSSIEGNNINSSPNELAFRASLGGELFTASYSIHPKVSGSWATTSSFENGSGYKVYNPDYITNVETISKNQVAVGIRTNTVDKILVVSSSLSDGDVLSPYRSIQQTQNLTPRDPDARYVEVALSPQNQINEDIISQIGYFNIGEYIGDVREMDKDGTNYPALDRLRDSYFEKYIKSYNLVDFIRLIKFFDNSLFKMIKDFTPSNVSLTAGVVVKQHILERNRIKRIIPVAENITYSGSTGVIESFGGGTGGSFERYQTSGSQFYLTQSWSEIVQTLNGPINKIIDDQREFYNGEFPNQFGGDVSFINTNVRGVDCTAYSNPSYSRSFTITPVFLNYTNYGLNEFLNPSLIPSEGVAWLWYDSTGVKYIKISNTSQNGFDIQEYLGGLTRLSLNLTNPIDTSGNTQPNGVYSWDLDSPVTTTNFTLFIASNASPSNIVGSLNATQQNFNFSATGDMIWHASASGDPVNPTLAGDFTASYVQGYFPVTSNYPTNQYIRGWANAQYYYEYEDYIDTTGTVTGNFSGFNRGVKEISTANLPSFNQIAGISTVPWFMKNISGVKQQTSFTDPDGTTDSQDITVVALKITNKLDVQLSIGSFDLNIDEMNNASACYKLTESELGNVFNPIPTIAPLFAEPFGFICVRYDGNEDKFTTDSNGKLILKEFDVVFAASNVDTTPGATPFGQTTLYDPSLSFVNFHPNSIISSGQPILTLEEGFYGIHNTSIDNDTATLTSLGTPGQIQKIRYCPQEAEPEDLNDLPAIATWEVILGDGNINNTSGNNIPNQLKQGELSDVYYNYGNNILGGVEEIYSGYGDWYLGRDYPVGSVVGHGGVVNLPDFSYQEVVTNSNTFLPAPSEIPGDYTVNVLVGEGYKPQEGDTLNTELGFNILLTDFIPVDYIPFNPDFQMNIDSVQLKISGGPGELPRSGKYYFRISNNNLRIRPYISGLNSDLYPDNIGGLATPIQYIVMELKGNKKSGAYFGSVPNIVGAESSQDISTLSGGGLGGNSSFSVTGQRTQTLLSPKSIGTFQQDGVLIFGPNFSYPEVLMPEGISTDIGARWKIELIRFEEN